MTIRRGGGPRIPNPARTSTSSPPKATDPTPQVTKHPPLSMTVDGFDGDITADTRVSGSGATLIDELLVDAKDRPSLMSTMQRVLVDTKKKLTTELEGLKSEATDIAHDPTLSLKDRTEKLDVVREKMFKPRARLVAIRRRMNITSSTVVKESDAAELRVRQAMQGAKGESLTTTNLNVATAMAQLKNGPDGAMAAGTIRIDVDNLSQKNDAARRLAHHPPSLDDARFILLSLFGRDVVQSSEKSPPMTSTASNVIDLLTERAHHVEC